MTPADLGGYGLALFSQRRACSAMSMLAAGLLALFYVPFALHPHFAETKLYIQARSGRPPYNNLGHLVSISTVYNSIYYLASLGLGLIIVLVSRLYGVAGTRWLLPAVALAWLVPSWFQKNLWLVQGQDYTILAYIVPLLLLWTAREKRRAWRAALIWFAIPFVAYVFIFADPRTHLYVFFAGAALLVGFELDRLFDNVRLLVARVALGVLFGGIALLAASYLWIVFIDHTPEYKRTFPENRIALFWTPYGDKMPTTGLFGFPYRAGWKVIGYLYATGVLQGDYDTNEEAHITRWYTRAQPTCDHQPRYYFIAKNVQDVQYVPQHEIEANYALIGQVRVEREAKLWLYQRKPVSLPYQEWDVRDYASLFDRWLSAPVYTSDLPDRHPLDGMQVAANLRLGESIEFLGYSIDRRILAPGEAFTMTLYWRTSAPVGISYTVFTHVEDPGVLWAQKDSLPRCGNRSTDSWVVGRIYKDPHTIVLPEGIPLGKHGLVAGLYRLETGERLPVYDREGNLLGDTLDLGTIEVISH